MLKHNTKRIGAYCIVFALGLITQRLIYTDFNKANPDPTQHASIEKIESCFTPSQACLPKIIHAIDQAQHSIYMQAYSFTLPQISSALKRAKLRGVTVTVIVDKSQLKAPKSQLTTLKNVNIPTFIDHKPAIAHNKIIIIDEKLVITGSYNFSYSAENRNAENVLFISHQATAKSYVQNFKIRLQSSTSIP